MFTGIIEELGTVESLEHRGSTAALHLRSPRVLDGIALGDSIAVDGCCLTVTGHDGESWSADVITTTLAATTLGRLTRGDGVNLERAVRADGRLDGHLVQGHVDGVGEVVGRQEQDGTTLLRIALPAELSRYVVARGSLAVDGVSLTVAAVEQDVAVIGLIPETLARTTLGRRSVGDPVNLEVDVLAKYVEKLLAGQGAQR
jgi:riboflavin synthase